MFYNMIIKVIQMTYFFGVCGKIICFGKLLNVLRSGYLQIFSFCQVFQPCVGVIISHCTFDIELSNSRKRGPRWDVLHGDGMETAGNLGSGLSFASVEPRGGLYGWMGSQRRGGGGEFRRKQPPLIETKNTLYLRK